VHRGRPSKKQGSRKAARSRLLGHLGKSAEEPGRLQKGEDENGKTRALPRLTKGPKRSRKEGRARASAKKRGICVE